MEAFNVGPFTLTPGRALRHNGTEQQTWSVSFFGDVVGSGVVYGNSPSRADVIEACSDAIASFKSRLRKKHAPARIDLRHFASDAVVASMSISVELLDGMSGCIADDRFEYWAERGDDDRGVYSRAPMTLQEWTEAGAKYAAPALHWITGLLPDDVLTASAEDWRAPIEQEIRCVVGEHSFTGVTGAAAAELVGVTPQNFRKYTAAEGSSTRQKISFAMWHLLLHKLGIKNL